MARPHKRARLSEPAIETNDNAEDDKHTLFTAWAKERGVEIDSVAPQQLPGRGLGLMTTAAVKEGTRLLFVPEKAMFKPDAAFVKRSGLERASPQAKLSVSIMAKFTAAGSDLATWETTWPTRQDFDASMPLSWPEELVDHLPKPVLAPLERQKADYERDWEAVKPLCEQRSWDEATFRYYWCIVNSRSFHWKPSAARAGSMVLCPFVDYMNHGPTGSGVDVTQTSKGYAVVAERDYEIGEEILATYGAHSNDKLLVHYGFVCASPVQHASPDDEIRLDHVIIPHLPDETKSQLQDVGFLGAYALLPSQYPCSQSKSAKDAHTGCSANCRQPWEICFKTQVAVRAVLLTANEWEYFVSNGEDLSGDKSSAVNAWLRPHLQAYKDEVIQEIKLVEDLGKSRGPRHALAVSIMKERWTQILVHIGNFLDSIPQAA